MFLSCTSCFKPCVSKEDKTSLMKNLVCEACENKMFADMAKESELKPWDKCHACGKLGKFIGSFCDCFYKQMWESGYRSLDTLKAMSDDNE